ncbi:hypothetical protein EMIHUDRAFT_248806 [Emiliania huxleyi CCMP1516]|uniref:Uncharacterized protein n=2 Tax=Emiliania huxleyi TaxID=2903 RepID=A0A0D3ID05_EMIH1|nr:hypothetical protein EMIHUDRAFT_248806 [Emiliania huxleyi CCMP1516]EOD09140.1 hypothetical protein EMIHUDRAFT_248806 [Emiliania huxleyi CCMP1516]|eukprot:XP_005761569.1 hypothetical protein EMIHUDRAFT_248806 [Emiliania huxleyi CCMP1516]
MPSIAERMASYAKSLASDGNGNPTLDAADMSHADAIPPTPGRGDEEYLCNNFRLDPSADFGMCKCGYKKIDHPVVNPECAEKVEPIERWQKPPCVTHIAARVSNSKRDGLRSL